MLRCDRLSRSSHKVIAAAERPRGFKSRRSPPGMAVALFKDCNEGLIPLGRSLWESRAVVLGCKRPGMSR